MMVSSPPAATEGPTATKGAHLEQELAQRSRLQMCLAYTCCKGTEGRTRPKRRADAGLTEAMAVQLSSYCLYYLKISERQHQIPV
jgi:hypothetical protein